MSLREITYEVTVDRNVAPTGGKREAYLEGKVCATEVGRDGEVRSLKLPRQRVVNLLRFHYKGSSPFGDFKEETEPRLWADGRLTSLREEGDTWYYVLEQEWLD